MTDEEFMEWLGSTETAAPADAAAPATQAAEPAKPKLSSGPSAGAKAAARAEAAAKKAAVAPSQADTAAVDLSDPDTFVGAPPLEQTATSPIGMTKAPSMAEMQISDEDALREMLAQRKKDAAARAAANKPAFKSTQKQAIPAGTL